MILAYYKYDSSSKMQRSQIYSASIPLPSKRVSQEQIINDGQASEQLLQSIVCPICLMILPMPHNLCENCDNAFCPDCLSKWLDKNPNQCIFKCQNPSFKTIKRSNTYNALVEVLKFRCSYCSYSLPLTLIDSHDRQCVDKPLKCPWEGCLGGIKRRELEEHTKACSFRQVPCQYCKNSYRASEITQHESEQCRAREIECENQLCRASIRLVDYREHRDSCAFQSIACQWCKDFLLKKDLQVHGGCCPEKAVSCRWCGVEMQQKCSQQHQIECPKKLVLCRLCEEEVLGSLYEKHKAECMFESLVELKQSRDELFQQNVKLKVKIGLLENELSESVKQFQEGAYNVLIRVKEEERKEFEKDLVRLNNGIGNIERLRTNELNEHLKRPHISSALCPFCNSIRRKLEEDLEPLLRQKEEINGKLAELDRLYNATVKSKIRTSKIAH